jgi:uncharacterized protein (TIGR02001 family)
MKKLTLVLVAVLALAASFTPASQAAVEVEGDAYIGIFDKYLWRGYDLSGGTSVLQGGMDLSAKGFTLSYWSNFQNNTDTVLGSTVESGNVTETDIVLDYSFDAGELLSVSLGNILYALDGLEDTNELYLSLGLNTLLSPTLSVYYDWDEADEAAMFYSASIGHSVDLVEGLSLSLGALVSYNQESDYAVGNYSDWHNYELSASIDYAVTEQITLTPSFLFSEGISDDAKTAIDSETVTGLTVALSF